MNKKSIYTLFSILLAFSLLVIAKSNNTRNDLRRNLQIFNNTVNSLADRYVDTLDLNSTVRTAIDAMLNTIDPYTNYYPDDEKEDLISVSTGEYAGIGLVVQKRDSSFVFGNVQWDGPAHSAGVRSGDRLLAIDSIPLSADDKIDDVRNRLRGKAGTNVTLQLQRPFTDHTHDFTLTIERATISIPTVTYAGMLNDSIGYIDITTFSNKTDGDFTKAYATLRDKGNLKGLVIDLRGNGGGTLDAAVDVISNFVPAGTRVVTTRGRNDQKLREYKTRRRPIDTSLPIVVLVDGNTASASEILSGTLQDLDRAVIVGERTFGKGLVQNVYPLHPNGMLKITTGRYYIPSGRLVQAIDYRRRNVDGSAKRMPDSLTTAYSTAGGRIVRDGGGITPDIKVDVPETNTFLYSIYADGWLDDYADLVANSTTTTPDPDTWVLPDSLIDGLKRSIDPKKLRRDRTTAQTIDYLRELAEIDGYLTDSVTMHLNALTQLLEQNLDRDFEVNHDEIVKLLSEELADRWWPKDQGLKRQLGDDKYIKEALIVLNDPRRYGAILTAPNTQLKGTPSNSQKTGSKSQKRSIPKK